MTLDPTDREALRSCKTGDCGLRLPAAAMESVPRKNIPWGTPAKADRPRGRCGSSWPTRRAHTSPAGARSCLTTRTGPARTPRAAAFKHLLRSADLQVENQPELFRWLDEFPRLQLDGC